jgi:hypothetical protein
LLNISFRETLQAGPHTFYIYYGMSSKPKISDISKPVGEEAFNFLQDGGSSRDPLIFGEFGKLQRLNLVSIQNDLATLKAEFHTKNKLDPKEKKELRQLLRAYGRIHSGLAIHIN